MKIFVDEHIPMMTVRTLRLMGHDIRDIRGTPDEGMQDDALWAMAQREERLLITTDKGFTQYRTAPHYGVLIIRLRRPNRQKIHTRIMQALRQFPELEWPGVCW
jgi:predicted nuclease of predicted toxin-antitoxin system